MAITLNDPKELKLRDFSYISMTNPPIPFLGLKMAKKGGFRAFLLSAVPISGSQMIIYSFGHILSGFDHFFKFLRSNSYFHSLS